MLHYMLLHQHYYCRYIYSAGFCCLHVQHTPGQSENRVGRNYLTVLSPPLAGDKGGGKINKVGLIN